MATLNRTLGKRMELSIDTDPIDPLLFKGRFLKRYNVCQGIAADGLNSPI